MIAFTIVCSKGELAQGEERFLKGEYGMDVDLNSKDYVQYTGRYRIVIMRSWDVPQITEMLGNDAEFGQVHGITGKDIFRNYKLGSPESPLRELRNLNFGYTKLCVLGKNQLSEYKQPIRVGSPYAFLAEAELEKMGYDVTVNQIKLKPVEGSWEALIDLNLADVVVDVVNNGKTSEANDLKESIKLLDSNAVLIGR